MEKICKGRGKIMGDIDLFGNETPKLSERNITFTQEFEYVSALIKYLEDQQVYGNNYMENTTEACKSNCLQAFIRIIQIICQKWNH